jgi:hypothetical protein
LGQASWSCRSLDLLTFLLLLVRVEVAPRTQAAAAQGAA